MLDKSRIRKVFAFYKKSKLGFFGLKITKLSHNMDSHGDISEKLHLQPQVCGQRYSRNFLNQKLTHYAAVCRMD